MANTYTTKLLLAKPARGDLDWDDEANGNYDLLDTCIYANREDRNMSISGGGILTYDALTGEIAFTADIYLHHGVNGNRSRIPVSESPLVCSDDLRMVYVIIPRAPTVATDLTVANGKLWNDAIAVPSSNNALVIAIRDSDDQIQLYGGGVLIDGLPGSLGGGTATTLDLAYQASFDGEINLTSDSKYFRIRSELTQVESLLQSFGTPTTGTELSALTEARIAQRFTVPTIQNLARVQMRVKRTGNPTGNYRLVVIENVGALPGYAPVNYKFTGAWTPVSSIPTVFTQVEEAMLVNLLPNHYWLAIETDATYLSTVVAGVDTIELQQSGVVAASFSAYYNEGPQLWSSQVSPLYFNSVYLSAEGPGVELFTVTQAAGGQVAVRNQAEFRTEGQVTHQLVHSGLKAYDVLSMTAPATLVVDSTEEMASVIAGSDMYVAQSSEDDNNGLFRVLSVVVDSPVVGQSTVTINQTASLANLGYKIALVTETPPSGCIADFLRASDTNRTFDILNDSGDTPTSLLIVDGFRNRAIIDGDLIVRGTQTYINTDTRVAESLLVEEALVLPSAVLFDVNNSGTAGMVARFRTGSANALMIPFSGGIEISRTLLFINDAVHDVGSALYRPKDVYASGSVIIGAPALGVTLTPTQIQAATTLLIRTVGVAPTDTISFQDQWCAAAIPFAASTTEYNNFVTLFGPSGSLLSSLTTGGPIGAAEDGSYTDGLFTDLVPLTKVGIVVDRFNEVLKSLAPQEAPPIAAISATVGSTSGKLSFDAANPIVGWASVDGIGALTALLVDQTVPVTSTRRGVLDGTVDMLGVLASNVVAGLGFPTPSYPAQSFGKANQGFLHLEVNGTVVRSVDLTVLGAVSDSVLISGFQLSASTPTSFANGNPFSLFQFRTGSYRVKPTDQRAGWNYVRVRHEYETGLFYDAAYVDWVNDIDTTATAFALQSLGSISMTGSKYLSGVNHHTGGSALYGVTVNDAYRNTYSDSSLAVSFTASGFVAPASYAFAAGLGNEAASIVVSESINIAPNIRRFGPLEELLIHTNIDRTVQTDASSSDASVGNFVLDNMPASSTALVENFDDENFRALPTDDYSLVTGGDTAWDSTVSLVGANPAYNDGLQVSNGTLIYPISNYSNILLYVNGPAGNVDYSGASGVRQFIRRFEFLTGVSSNFTMTISGTGVTFIPQATAFSLPTEAKVSIRLPSQTGWLDAYEDFIIDSWADGDGGRLPANGVGRALGTLWGLTVGSKTTANSDDKVMVRIEVPAGFTGSFTSITFNFLPTTGEEYFTVGPGGQSLFTLGTFTFDPSHQVRDVDVFVNGIRMRPDLAGGLSFDYRKVGSTQIEFASLLPEFAVVAVVPL
jgi:hypothetical protein